MARQTQTAEVNSFVKGLITEASPLTFPDNASLDEDNFVLRRDGSRDRRLGIDYESGAVKINAGIGSIPEDEVGFSSFSWKNAGGQVNKTLIIVQTGNVIRFFDIDITPLSSGVIYTHTFTSADISQVFSYADVDGLLVVATGQKKVQVFSYDGTNVTHSTKTLRVRDQFGVEDTLGGTDLTEGSGLIIRPSTLTEEHTYNLRNQTWAAPRRARAGDYDPGVIDPLDAMKDETGNWPSNSDAVTYALGPWLEDGESEDSFLVRDLTRNPPGAFPAAKGYFVIDALDRGASRLAEVTKLYGEYGALNHAIGDLPTDSTPGGATAVEEFAGRVWYAGFPGEIIDGDDKSPQMSSYVLFSQLVEDPSDITKCYQEGDPTSVEAPDIVDTDGGFIRVDGAYRIQRLINVGAALMVIAENGVWSIQGGGGEGFTATQNKRTKITDRGTTSPGSVVVVDNTFLYWADDAIYHIVPNQFGEYEAKNLTQSTIQTFYDEITPIDKVYAQGIYDSYDRKVRWVYQNRIQDTGPNRELVLDMTLGAFYPSTIQQLNGSAIPRVVCPVQVSPFRLTTEDTDVVYGGETVLYNTETVVQSVNIRGAGSREVEYVTLTSVNPVTFTFSFYRDQNFKDWASEDGVGVDAPAFLVTGYLSGGDFLRYKQVPYVQFHLRRTEDGFEDDGTGNWFPTNESSCLVQAQWEWANSANSNRWGRPFQAYRYRRLYMPANVSDPFDNGFEVITTKNKLRGKGKVVSLKIYTEEEKDLRLLGWSMIFSANGNV